MAKLKKGKGGLTSPYKDSVKVQVVTQYLALGKAPLVSALTGVPRQTIRLWKTQPWWGELVREIQAESNQETDGKLTKIIDKSLNIINDRLENGELIYNSKTGETMRLPVKLRDVGHVTRDLFAQRDKIRKEPELREKEEASADRLLKLAETFADFAKTLSKQPKTRTIEAEVLEEMEEDALHEERQARLQNGVREVRGETVSDQESLPEEPGESGVREDSWGSDGEGHRPQEADSQGGRELQVEPSGSLSFSQQVV